MPNHIKNRIELIGSPEDIQNLIYKFSTPYEKSKRKTHDEKLLIFKGNGGEYGWYDEKENIFEYGGNKKGEKIKGVPIGYEQDYDEAWVRFPDFNKIFPMPEGLEIGCHSGIETWVEICTGQINFKSLFANSGKSFGEIWGGDPGGNGFDTMMNSMKASTAMECIIGQKGRKNVKDFSDEDFESFIQVLKNYRKHGFMSWYQWAIKNWGTKWNSYDCNKISENIYEFGTAWSGVPHLIDLISKDFPSVFIRYKYSAEDTGSNCGTGEYRGGQITFTQFESQSKEAYELAFDLRPSRKDDYQLVGDKYEYVDKED